MTRGFDTVSDERQKLISREDRTSKDPAPLRKIADVKMNKQVATFCFSEDRIDDKYGLSGFSCTFFGSFASVYMLR